MKTEKRRSPREIAAGGVAVLAFMAACACAQTPPAAPTNAWTWCGWGGGGFFRCAAWSPAHEGTILISGDVSGVYKTDDKGKHWRLSNAGISEYGVFSLAFAPSAPDTAYAMTLHEGLCKSTDGGESWKALPQTQKDNLNISAHCPLSVRAIAVDPVDAAVVYAGSKSGKLYKTKDGGQTWLKLTYLSTEPRTVAAPSFTGTGSLVLEYSAPTASWSDWGRVERIYTESQNFAAFKKLSVHFLLPQSAPIMEVQLAIQTGDAWQWQAGPFVAGQTGQWTEATLDLENIKNPAQVRALYVIARSPHNAYQGPLFVDALALHADKTSVVTRDTAPGSGIRILVDWETPENVEGWSPNSKLPNMKRVESARQSQAAVVDTEHGVITSVAVARTNPRKVFLSSSVLGAYRSENSGETWSACATPNKVLCVTVSPSDESVVYAACAQEGVYKSRDGGKTWASTSEGLNPKFAIRETVVNPKDPQQVRCIGSSGWSGAFYASTNGGATWEGGSRKVAVDLKEDPTLPLDAKYASGFSDLQNLCLNPAHPEELLSVGNWRVVFSDDDGKSWQERSRGADISCVEDIQFAGANVYATCMDEGMLSSADGGLTWKQLIPLKHTDGVSGHQWRVRIIPNNAGGKLVSTLSPWGNYPNKVLISEDGGKTFTAVTNGLPTSVSTKNCMWGRSYPRALTLDPSNASILYLGMDGDPEPGSGKPGNGIFKSTDGGRNWKQLPNQPPCRLMFYGLEVDPTNARRLYWGGNKENGGLYRSEDGGDSWQKVFDKETYIWTVMLTQDGTVYCGNVNLWRSRDHGATWSKLTDFKDKLAIVGMAYDPADEKRVWVSKIAWGETAVGQVLKTSDGGTSWQDMTGTLEHMYKKPLVLRYNGDTHELWGAGMGIFKIRQ